MHVIEQYIKQVRDEADEAWKAQTPVLDEKQVQKAQELVIVLVSLWWATKDLLATCPPTDRLTKRMIAGMLRSAEQAITSVLSLANALENQGANLKRVKRLAAAQREVRGIILMPMARQMAARDPEHREATVLRDILRNRVPFVDGRPVIPRDLAAELPYPLEAEPVG